MVYWRDIPKDHDFKNPFHTTDLETNPKYLTFEPDSGDWNNKRMGLETAAVMALVTGRILVLPPSSNETTFTNIFPFDSISKEYNMKVITMEEFLEREGMTGNLRDARGLIRIPNRTNWDGDPRHCWDLPLWPFIRDVTQHVNWMQHECVAGIPDQPGQAGMQRMKQYWDMATNSKPILEDDWKIRVEGYTANPTPVDAPPQDRLREMIAQRIRLCMYDDVYHNSKYLHNLGLGPSRMLVHFYAMIFFEDWRQDLWVKRFVRDHFRYVDELQCAAARIVEALRQTSIEQTGDPEGHFDTFHIRRGDMLDFKGSSNIDAGEIYKRSRLVLGESGSVVYIATDERDKSFFEPLKQRYSIYFLDDFQELLPGISVDKFPQLDQLVASKGRIFVGLFGSTFTGYINRMRAYHAMKNKVPGWEEGAIPSYFYADRENKYQMRHYRALAPPLWSREFPISWRDIDHDVLEEDFKS